MKPDDTPRDVEPPTSVEPTPHPGDESSQSASRRAVSVASHTGVAAAGAASVIAAQRVSGSPHIEHSAESLDVFSASEQASSDPAPRGLSAEAMPVPPSPAPTDTPPLLVEPTVPHVAAPPVPETPAVLQQETERADPVPAGETGAEVSFATPELEPTIEVQETVEPEPFEEPERVTVLAEAAVDVGGGLVPEDDADLLAVFGAASEVGALPLDEATLIDDEDEDLASAP